MKSKFFNDMMAKIIEDEISSFESNGEKVVLRTLVKKRNILIAVFGIITLLFSVFRFWSGGVIALVVLFFLLYRINNVSIVAGLARKFPDRDIRLIIQEDMAN